MNYGLYRDGEFIWTAPPFLKYFEILNVSPLGQSVPVLQKDGNVLNTIKPINSNENS